MAHLQYQFDIHNCEFIENHKLIIPVCLDYSISEILKNVRNDRIKLVHLKFRKIFLFCKIHGNMISRR